MQRRRYVVLGAGRQGRAAAYDLARHAQAGEVALYDRESGCAQAAARRVNELLERAGLAAVCRGAQLEVTEPAALQRALEPADCVLSCVPYFLNEPIAQAAVAARTSYCDLGGNTAVSDRILALDPEARAAGVTLTPDCGLAPGMANTLAACLIERIARPRRAAVRCGGLPQRPRPPLDYMLTFAVEGLTNEYTGAALVLREGRVTEIPTFDPAEDESLEVEGVGRLEAFVTSGGSGNLPRTYAGRLEHFDYKTLRYPGHAERIRLLLALGLLDREPVTVPDADGNPVSLRPRDLLHERLVSRLTFPDEPDLVVLLVTAEGLDEHGAAVRHRFEIVDRFDPETGFTAMERTTAFPAAIIAAHLASDRAPRGAIPLERVMDGEAFVAELRRRPFAIRESFERTASPAGV
ncbi:MAG: hypothetical protein D6776_06700 [Planctomycetota bacterium]|nr:MAG: hypothetical protein D6776_06700 [Planctomycetota bacterium]